VKNIELYQEDLPDGLDLGPCVAVDTETLGLNLNRDRLCLVQLSAGDGRAHLVQFSGAAYAAPRLSALLGNPKVEKLCHFARFDLGMLERHLGVVAAPLFCTRVASMLTRTYTDRHGLKDLCRELLGVEISKQQQSSDWGAPALSPEQLAYAAADVLYLHALRDKLTEKLTRTGRLELAQKVFAFLPTRAQLDLAGWPEIDIFAHH
jgi:ribonuclease D